MAPLRTLKALEREGLLMPDPRLEAAAQSMAIALTPEMTALIDRLIQLALERHADRRRNQYSRG